MKRTVGILFLTAVFLFASCSQGLSDTRSLNTATPAATTQILTGDSLSRSLTSVSGEGTGNTVVMNGSPADYPVGGHLILGDSEQTPGGRLYKVVGAKSNGDGTVTLSVENGLLSDAIQDADFSYSGVVTPDSTSGATIVPYAAEGAKAINFSQTFEVDLGKVNLVQKIEEWAKVQNAEGVNASDILKLNIGGKIKITPTINLDLKIENFKTTYALFDIGAKLETNLIVDGGIEYNWNFPIPLFKLNVGVITIMAGPVPIIIQPQFDIILNVYGQVEAMVTFTVKQETELQLTAEQTDGVWDTSRSKAIFKKPELGGLNPTLSLHAGVSLTESVGITLYGVLGVCFNVTEFADLDVQIMDGSQSMILDYETMELASFADLYTGKYLFELGVAANVGIRISALGFINQDFSVWGDRWVLARWQMNEDVTGYEKDPLTGMYGRWDYPAIQHLIDG